MRSSSGKDSYLGICSLTADWMSLSHSLNRSMFLVDCILELRDSEWAYPSFRAGKLPILPSLSCRA